MLCSIFEHYKIFMDPKQTIKKNLERRSKSVDIVETYKASQNQLG